MDIRRKLSDAGKNGITYLSTDPSLPEVRAEIRKMRMYGLNIKESVVPTEKHSMTAGKRVKFVLEGADI